MARLPDMESPMKDKYTVGYGKPPEATRFGNRPQPKRSTSMPATDADAGADLVATINRSIKVRQRGKEVSMHPHEATMHGLAKSGLSGKIGALREFLSECKKAGLLVPPPTRPTNGVITVPKGMPVGLAARLVRAAGAPPWDAELLEEFSAEYERDREIIERLAEQEKARQNAK
jgi:hypothetical protein